MTQDRDALLIMCDEVIAGDVRNGASHLANYAQIIARALRDHLSAPVLTEGERLGLAEIEADIVKDDGLILPANNIERYAIKLFRHRAILLDIIDCLTDDRLSLTDPQQDDFKKNTELSTTGKTFNDLKSASDDISLTDARVGDAEREAVARKMFEDQSVSWTGNKWDWDKAAPEVKANFYRHVDNKTRPTPKEATPPQD